MEDKITVDEPITNPAAGHRAATEASAAWHLSELVRHLEDVAEVKRRGVDIPDPLFFADLLQILGKLEIEPAEFFRGVVRRWTDDLPTA